MVNLVVCAVEGYARGDGLQRDCQVTRTRICSGCNRFYSGRVCMHCRPPKKTDPRWTYAYQKERAEILKPDATGVPPFCHWGCGRHATTADHVPPLSSVPPGQTWDGKLVPACEPCNFSGRHQKTVTVRIHPLHTHGPAETRTSKVVPFGGLR